MAHAIRSQQARSTVAEWAQPKLRLAEASRVAANTTKVDPQNMASAGFEYWEVQVVYDAEGLKVSYPGLLDKELAIEFSAMLNAEVAPRPVRVIWAAGWARDYDRFSRMHERLHDMIVSVRSADRPGHEFQARLGYFGPYEGYAVGGVQ